MFTSKIIFIVTIANAVTILVSSITLAKPVIAKKIVAVKIVMVVVHPKMTRISSRNVFQTLWPVVFHESTNKGVF